MCLTTPPRHKMIKFSRSATPTITQNWWFCRKVAFTEFPRCTSWANPDPTLGSVQFEMSSRATPTIFLKSVLAEILGFRGLPKMHIWMMLKNRTFNSVKLPDEPCGKPYDSTNLVFAKMFVSTGKSKMHILGDVENPHVL